MSENFEKYIEILHANPLFKDIPASNITSMLSRLNAYTKSYKKDEYVKHISDTADFIGIILSGEIHILKDDYDGNRRITASIQAGSMFGEAFACAGISHLPVDIMAVDNCIILYLDSQVLLNSCDSCFNNDTFDNGCPDTSHFDNHSFNKSSFDNGCSYHHILIRNLLGIVAHKNISLNQKLRCVSHKTTKEKLLAYLSQQAKQHNSKDFTINFNRQELADYLGVERSAMSAEISKLVKSGTIETHRSHFTLKY